MRLLVSLLYAKGNILQSGTYTTDRPTVASWQWLTNSMNLLEKLVVPQLVTLLPQYYGIRMFITAFTKAHNFFPILSQLNPVYDLTPLSPNIHFSIIFNIFLCKFILLEDF